MRSRTGVQYATVTTRKCPMFDSVCAAKVAEHIASLYPQPFDAMALIEEKCGRFTRGKHKGELRGWATISICTEGGWKKHGPGEGNGGVIYPGTLVSVSIGDDFSGTTYLEVR